MFLRVLQSQTELCKQTSSILNVNIKKIYAETDNKIYSLNATVIDAQQFFLLLGINKVIPNVYFVNTTLDVCHILQTLT